MDTPVTRSGRRRARVPERNKKCKDEATENLTSTPNDASSFNISSLVNKNVKNESKIKDDDDGGFPSTQAFQPHLHEEDEIYWDYDAASPKTRETKLALKKRLMESSDSPELFISDSPVPRPVLKMKYSCRQPTPEIDNAAIQLLEELNEMKEQMTRDSENTEVRDSDKKDLLDNSKFDSSDELNNDVKQEISNCDNTKDKSSNSPFDSDDDSFLSQAVEECESKKPSSSSSTLDPNQNKMSQIVSEKNTQIEEFDNSDDIEALMSQIDTTCTNVKTMQQQPTIILEPSVIDNSKPMVSPSTNSFKRFKSADDVGINVSKNWGRHHSSPEVQPKPLPGGRFTNQNIKPKCSLKEIEAKRQAAIRKRKENEAKKVAAMKKGQMSLLNARK